MRLTETCHDWALKQAGTMEPHIPDGARVEKMNRVRGMSAILNHLVLACVPSSIAQAIDGSVRDIPARDKVRP